MKTDITKEILLSREQLRLYGFKKIFNSFIKLYNEKRLPNTILITGQKGIGKATFAYHFTNYLLSLTENDRYSVNKFEINPNNKSFKLIKNNSHPNLFTLNNSKNEKVKIDYVRNLLNFLTKTSYLSDFKIVIIDNVELLTKNSSNALLKALEEPSYNTFFLIIHNNSSKILETIKSRSVSFRLFFTKNEKLEIFSNLINDYNEDLNLENFNEIFNHDTPGNVLKYILTFGLDDENIVNDKLSSILLLIEKYKDLNDPETLIYISSFIESFYTDLSLKNRANINNYFANKFKILKKFDDFKKFNLDKKNLFLSVNGVLKNDSK